MFWSSIVGSKIMGHSKDGDKYQDKKLRIVVSSWTRCFFNEKVLS